MEISCDFPGPLTGSSWNISPPLPGNASDPFDREAVIFVSHLKLKGKFLVEAKFYCDCHSISASSSFSSFLNFY